MQHSSSVMTPLVWSRTILFFTFWIRLLGAYHSVNHLSGTTVGNQRAPYTLGDRRPVPVLKSFVLHAGGQLAFKIG